MSRRAWVRRPGLARAAAAMTAAGALALVALVAGSAAAVPATPSPRGLAAPGSPEVAAEVRGAAQVQTERLRLVDARAHRELLAKVIADSEVDTERRAPGALERLAAKLADRWRRLIRSLFSSLGTSTARGVSALLWLAGLASAAVLAVVALAVLRSALRNRRAASPAAARGAAGEALPAAVDEPPPAASAWRAELERRLAAGRAGEALEALWWWLARTLAGPRAEASWTGRELVARCRRPDLAAPVARLDALLYGPAGAEPAAVRELAERLESAVGRGSGRAA